MHLVHLFLKAVVDISPGFKPWFVVFSILLAHILGLLILLNVSLILINLLVSCLLFSLLWGISPVILPTVSCPSAHSLTHYSSSHHHPLSNPTAALGFLVAQWINRGLLPVLDNHSSIHPSHTLLTPLTTMYCKNKLIFQLDPVVRVPVFQLSWNKPQHFCMNRKLCFANELGNISQHTEFSHQLLNLSPLSGDAKKEILVWSFTVRCTCTWRI